MQAPDRWLLLIHAAATLFMVGVIWFVQVVHYPLFDAVGREEFSRYESRHQQLVTLVVGPTMLIEALTAVLLIRWGVQPVWITWSGLGLLVVIWASTAFLQVPCHEQLNQSFVASTHTFLVVSNWVRTVAWSLRGVLVLLLLADRMGS
jgi:hypothetical protein